MARKIQLTKLVKNIGTLVRYEGKVYTFYGFDGAYKIKQTGGEVIRVSAADASNFTYAL